MASAQAGVAETRQADDRPTADAIGKRAGVPKDSSQFREATPSRAVPSFAAMVCGPLTAAATRKIARHAELVVNHVDAL